MPLSFGALGKAIAVLIIVAFVAWLVVVYMIGSEEAAVDAETIGAVEMLAPPLA